MTSLIAADLRGDRTNGRRTPGRATQTRDTAERPLRRWRYCRNVTRADTSTHDQFRLSGAWNFRDLGGLRTTDGATTAAGVVFRSSHLAGLNESGQRSLVEVGITDVYDLRGPREIAHDGSDNLPDGVRLNVRSFRADERASRATSSHHTRPRRAAPQRTHASTWSTPTPHCPRSTAQRSRSRMPRAASRTEAVPCCSTAPPAKTARGGSAISLLTAIGVTEDDVLADYLRSNEAVGPLRTALVARYGDKFDISDEILGVTEDYYRIGMRTVADAHGSFTAYLDAIGVDDGLRGRLRERLLR